LADLKAMSVKRGTVIRVVEWQGPDDPKPNQFWCGVTLDGETSGYFPASIVAPLDEAGLALQKQRFLAGGTQMMLASVNKQLRSASSASRPQPTEQRPQSVLRGSDADDPAMAVLREVQRADAEAALVSEFPPPPDEQLPHT